MTWSVPETWVVGERPASDKLNRLRDQLAALVTLGGPSMLNPLVAMGVVATTSVSLGGGSDDPTGLDFSRLPVDWDAMNALSSSTQWRIRTVFNVSTIVPGGPSAVNWTARIRTSALAGSATAQGAIQTVGTAKAVTNTVGFKALDSGYSAVSGAGLAVYTPIWNSNRTGGSGPGVADPPYFWFEVRAT